MFAVLKTGGKQYRVAQDDLIRVEKLEAAEGSDIELNDVLLVFDGKKTHLGNPMIAGAKVIATVVRQMRDRKVIIFKKKRRHNYRRKNGHRQHLSVLKIKEIVAA